jgi:CelD/BcsL family acetyltransferase involved in cellulose biosynthesis
MSDWKQLQPAWDDFARQHPKGSVFHMSAMVQVFEAAKGQTPVALAAIAEDGRILSLLVAVRVQTLPHVLGVVSSRSVWYAEPICEDTDEGLESLGDLIAEHDRRMRRRTLFTEIRPLWASGAERVSLERHGYRYLDYLNFVIDTAQPVDVLWKNMSGSVQSQVRKCERRGYRMQLLGGPEGVDILYDLLRLTYGRAEVPLADRSMFQAAYDILRPQGMIEFVVIYDGDRPVAADTMLLCKKQVFAWYGGSHRISGVSPAAFMQWREIEWSAQNGFEHYDFGGAGWPDVPYGVRDFKASFGGKLVCYGRYRKVYSRWKMALAERAYQFGRSVISPK